MTTTIDTGGRDTVAAEWVQTDLTVLFPQVFRLQVVRINNTYDCFGCDPVWGEYPEAFAHCLPASSGPRTVLEVKYLDFSGAIGNDVILSLRGFMPGDSRPSSFDGSPGFVDCNQTRFALEVAGGEPWQTGTGAIVPPGAVILNPTPPLVVGTEDIPVSHLKARFR